MSASFNLGLAPGFISAGVTITFPSDALSSKANSLKKPVYFIYLFYISIHVNVQRGCSA